MRKIMKTVFGSHLYGLNTEHSDMDFKGIYLPTIDDILLNSYKPIINKDTNKKGKNDNTDVDEELFALPKFIELACRGETVVLDMLFSNAVEYDCLQDSSLGHIWVSLQNNRHRFITKNLKAYIGYLKGHVAKNNQKGKKLKNINNMIRMLNRQEKEQPGRRLKDIWQMLPTGNEIIKGELDGELYWSLFGSKYKDHITIKYCIEQMQLKSDSYGARIQETAKNNVDFKAASHALRAGYQIIDLYETGFYSYPLAQTAMLRDVKAGKYDYETEIAPELERIISEIETLSDNSDYPEKIDKEFWNEWLIGVYEDAFEFGCDNND